MRPGCEDTKRVKKEEQNERDKDTSKVKKEDQKEKSKEKIKRQNN